jgi:hypothetical protein
MILLTGAALFVRGLNELNNSREGWRSDRVVTGTVVLPTASYGDAEKIATFHRLTLERLQALPGVAGGVDLFLHAILQLARHPEVRRRRREPPKPGQEPAAVVNTISPGYFETFQSRLLTGRPFTDSDILTSPKVFIISEATATRSSAKKIRSAGASRRPASAKRNGARLSAWQPT